MDPRGNTFWLAGLVAFLLVLASGCAGGKNAVRVIAEEAGAAGAAAARTGERLPDGSIRPRPLGGPVLPKGDVPKAGSLVEARAIDLVGPHADDFDEEQLRELVTGACTAKDLMQSADATSWQDAAAKATVNFGGNATLRLRVQALGEDLSTAEGSPDVFTQLAVFAVCETAD